MDVSSGGKGMRIVHTNAIAVGAILAVALITYFVLIPIGVRDQRGHGLPPRFFPQLWTLCLIGISALHLALILFLPRSREATVPVEPWPRTHQLRGGVVILLLFVYVFLAIESLGFFVSSTLMLIGSFLLLGERSVVRMIAIPAVLLLAVFYLFERVLHVVFPRGMFW